MKIPTKITVFDKTYKIKKVKKLVSDEGEIADGLFDISKKTISIREVGTDEEMFTTFLHELNHLILHESAIGQTDLSKEVEEIIVEQISKVYARLFNIKLRRKRRII